MMRLIGAGIILAVFGTAVAVALSMSHQPDASLAGGQRPESTVQTQATVPSGHQRDYACPPIGTEGPPERHLPESLACAAPAKPAPAYCP